MEVRHTCSCTYNVESMGKMDMEYMFISKSVTKGKGTRVREDLPITLFFGFKAES